jgi:conjugative transfer region protein TrbK
MMRFWFNRDTRHEHGGTKWAVLRFAIITCIAALAIVAFGEALRTDVPGRFTPPAAKTADPLAANAACRDITAEQLAADDTCRRVWAENRRRFFARTAPAAYTSDTPSKTQDRIPTSITPSLSDEAR